MWTTDKAMLLIEKCRNVPALWDKSSSEYRDNNKKLKELNSIAEYFGTSVNEVLRKIKSLDTLFIREHKKFNYRGISPEERIWYDYNVLRFIIEVDEHRERYRNLQADYNADLETSRFFSNENIDAGIDEIIPENTVEETTLKSTANGNAIEVSKVSTANERYERKENNDGHAEDTYKKFMQCVMENILQRDDFSIYAENVASRMRNASQNPRAIAVAKNQIDNILFKLEMGVFQNSVIQCNLDINQIPRTPDIDQIPRTPDINEIPPTPDIPSHLLEHFEYPSHESPSSSQQFD